MKPRRIVRGERVAPGLVLTRDGAGRPKGGDPAGARGAGLPKGRILSEADVAMLESGAWTELSALELERGDVHEEIAGRRLAQAVAGGGGEGGGVGGGPAEGGPLPLAASRRGLLELDAERLTALNLIPDVAVSAHPPGYVAVEGGAIGRAKGIPFGTQGGRRGGG